MKGKIVLVGASGMMGSATLDVARRLDLDVVPTYHTRMFEGGICFKLETDAPECLNIKADDVVIIFAAFSDQEWVRTHPLQARGLNVIATARLANEARKKKAHLIFLSSEAVFGKSQAAGWTEASSPCPSTEYGRQKYEVEKMLQTIGGACIVRTGWNVSFRFQDRCVVQSTYENLLRGSARLAEDNCFSLTAANDTARVLVHVAVERISGVVHAVSGTPITRVALADEIIKNSIKGREMNYEKIRFSNLVFKEAKPACSWLLPTRETCCCVPKFLLPAEIIAKKVRVLDTALDWC